MQSQFNNYITIDGSVCEGNPVFKGTRIMVWQVLELLGQGVTIEEIRKDYFPQLSKEAILSVLTYASKLVGEEKYVVF